jgi:large subunit ribosomal protein L18
VTGLRLPAPAQALSARLQRACCLPPVASHVTPALPRRTNNHIYAQVVDDVKGHVLCAASTIEKGAKKDYGGNCASATEVGARIAERAKAKGIETVHFDRNGKKYHGRVAALAEAAREAGLSF